MRKRIINFSCLILCIFACVFLDAVIVKADTGYSCLIYDEADLLTPRQEQDLYEKMQQIVPYGSFALLTNSASSSYSGEASDYARRHCNSLFQGESGTVMLIDMYNRRIEFYSTGQMYKVLNKARANQIADDIYSYATNEEYYECVSVALDEIILVLEGGKLSYTFRYVTNVFLAIGCALMVNYLCAWGSRLKGTSGQVVEATDDGTTGKFAQYIQIDYVKMLKRTKTHHSSSSSGGSGGGGGGGGGGGHSF